MNPLPDSFSKVVRTDEKSGLSRYETELKSQGVNVIVGLDEAGRGPLAGPVVAAACMLPSELYSFGFDDSKKLSEQQREYFFAKLTTDIHVDYGIGIAENVEIDRHNILRATFLAMQRAINGLKAKPEVILIDGHLAPSFGIPTIPIVKGDSKSVSIAAASILAKVTRDRIMNQWDEKFPQYGFKEHKGYGTAKHLKALHSYGPCSIHRTTFEPIKNFLDTSSIQLDLSW